MAELLYQTFGHPPMAESTWVNKALRYAQAFWVGKSPKCYRFERRLAELAATPLFDRGAYLAENQDVAAARIDPAEHYVNYGIQEGRDPHPMFDTAYYLRHNSDVAASGIEPLAHYQRHGAAEGRSINAYLPAASTPFDADSLKDSRHTERKRLLIFSHEASRTGAPLVLLELLRRFVAAGEANVCVVLLTGGPLESEFRSLAATIVLSQKQAADPDFRRLLAVSRFLLGDAAPHAAICNTVCTSVMAKGCAQHGIPVLSLVHEMPTSIDGYAGVEVFPEMLRHSCKLTVVSEFARQQFASRYGVDPASLAVTPPGCYRSFSAMGNRHRARTTVLADLGLPPNVFLVLGCGSIQARKGVDLFVQTAGACRRLGHENIHFLWVGEGCSEAIIWLNHDATALEVGERIHFLGATPDPMLYFQGVDVFFLPSREDPFPQVVLEAMAAGLPVVVFAGGGGAAEAVADGAGIICPYLDVPAAAKAICALAKDPEQGRKIGQAAAARVAEQFSFQAYVEAVKTIVMDVCS